MKKGVSPQEAAAMIPDGAVLMIGGFMGVGSPHRIIDALVEAGRRQLTVIANDTGRVDYGIGRLVRAGAIRRLVASHIGLNPETGKAMIDGVIDVELTPQGTLAERIRAGGYGLGGVLTKTGLGTLGGEKPRDHRDRRRAMALRAAAEGGFRIDLTPTAPIIPAISPISSPRPISIRSWRPPRQR